MHLAKNYYTQIIYLKVFVSMHFKLAEDCKNKIKVKQKRFKLVYLYIFCTQQIKANDNYYK